MIYLYEFFLLFFAHLWAGMLGFFGFIIVFYIMGYFKIYKGGNGLEERRGLY